MTDASVVTIDVDWAPDFAVDLVAEVLVEHGVRATWFVTHESPAIDRLRDHPALFELGLHPNFLPGSTHGADPAEVLRRCMEIVPGATSMRSHALVQSTRLLDAVIDLTQVRIDVSLFMPREPPLRPIEHWSLYGPLLRIPYVWEDDFETLRPDPWWYPDRVLGLGAGIKIFDFHPIHVALNTATLEAYDELKRLQPDVSKASASTVASLRQDGPGTATMFRDLCQTLATTGTDVRIDDIAERFSPADMSRGDDMA